MVIHRDKGVCYTIIPHTYRTCGQTRWSLQPGLSALRFLFYPPARTYTIHSYFMLLLNVLLGRHVWLPSRSLNHAIGQTSHLSCEMRSI